MKNESESPRECLDDFGVTYSGEQTPLLNQ